MEIESKRCFVDYQEVKLQDSMGIGDETGGSGSNRQGGGVDDRDSSGSSGSQSQVAMVPRSITLSLLGSDIVDSISAGDDVVCVGKLI